ncbi:hypothetical protein [Clostridium septicum]|uniref:Uncharacterized protein n=1 Tax=Clostridium septicum TaxID=1504 RepID=A0A9N7JME4_CLOSE|nr:hypothetical protein [Clostridium septicum]AYE34819.1 hypothetical protein CP523_10625 [Clostridium septicum]MDU1313365.1 hypothetical protein [Clostridium septicum]QAS60214.1 hypothetical protein EI377_05410 [Clostridium septicum]UEC20532.1 hypothetical protein LK444_14205 [Clostridium septicum]USS01413.1 hypothetical protein NH397_02970 [Clostridium septicum]
MGDYREEYRKYYEEVKRKANIKTNVENYKETPVDKTISIKEENIYPNSKAAYGSNYIGNYVVGYRGNYRGPGLSYNYGYSRREELQKPNRYVRRIIMRLTATALLFISVLVLKVLPYEQAKDIYSTCKEMVSENFNYVGFVEELKKFSSNAVKEVQGRIDEAKENQQNKIQNNEKE